MRRSSCTPLIAHEVQPALRLPLRARRCRVHRIPPRVRDDRDTPPHSGRDGAGCKSDLGQAGTEIFLQIGLDTGVAEQPDGQITCRSRRAASTGNRSTSKAEVVIVRHGSPPSAAVDLGGRSRVRTRHHRSRRHSVRAGERAVAGRSLHNGSLLVHRVVIAARSGRLASANLTPATGARTTLPSAHAPFVSHANRSRGSTRPAIAMRARRCRVQMHRGGLRCRSSAQRAGPS
jgi:hypothetical protein